MTHTVLLLVVFLLNGEPRAHVVTLAPDVLCDAAEAVNLAHRVEAQLAEPIQDEILWRCLPVRSPGPAAAPDAPRHRVPNRDEASVYDVDVAKFLERLVAAEGFEPPTKGL